MPALGNYCNTGMSPIMPTEEYLPKYSEGRRAEVLKEIVVAAEV